MSESDFNTTHLKGWVEGLQSGDRAAADALFTAACGRLERIARHMLRRFPNVGDYADTDEVLQNTLVRLWRTLEQVPAPPSTRDFFNLATAHVRRSLLDLARYFKKRARTVARPGGDLPPDASVPADAMEDLDRWCEFHEQVERLAPEVREVVSLAFYHGLPQKDVAAILDISERTVRRRWDEAREKLGQVLREGEAGAGA